MLNRGQFMGKIDLSSAYRSVRLHPSDYSRAGLAWQFEGETLETFLYDTRLMFGARMSACVFNTLTKAVIQIMQARGHGENYLVYCDDFFITHPTAEGCRALMNELMALLRQLGFSINYSKVIGPDTNITFLGVEIDTHTYTLSLPMPKLIELVADLNAVRKKHTVTVHNLQSICGKLNWAAQVIYGGRIYMRRLINAMSLSQRPNHHINISSEMKRDLDWWATVAGSFNGTASIIDDRPTKPVCTDACLTGAGGYFDGQWYYVDFSKWPGTENMCINYKEILAVVPAIHLWARQFQDRKIAIHIDNMSACYILNKGSCKDPFVQQYIREMHAISVEFNFRLIFYHLSGSRNIVADAASRLSEPNGWKRLQAALQTIQPDPDRSYQDDPLPNAFSTNPVRGIAAYTSVTHLEDTRYGADIQETAGKPGYVFTAHQDNLELSDLRGHIHHPPTEKTTHDIDYSKRRTGPSRAGQWSFSNGGVGRNRIGGPNRKPIHTQHKHIPYTDVHTDSDRDTIQRVINNGYASIGQNGNTLPSTSILQKHAISIRLSSEIIHTILQVNGSRTSASDHPAPMSIRSTFREHFEIQVNTPISKHSKDNTRGVGNFEPTRGGFLPHTNSKGSQESTRGRNNSKRAYDTPNAPQHIRAYKPCNNNGRRNVGSSTVDVLWAAQALQCDTNGPQGFQPSATLAPARHNIYSERNRHYHTMEQNKSIPHANTRHSIASQGWAPAMPSSGGIPCIQTHTPSARGWASLRNHHAQCGANAFDSTRILARATGTARSRRI